MNALWSTLATLFDGLTADAKAEIRAITFNGGSDVDDSHKVVKAYHYIVTKYGTTVCPDFIWGQTINPSNAVKQIKTSSNNAVVVILSISVISLTALGAFFILRKKKFER